MNSVLRKIYFPIFLSFIFFSCTQNEAAKKKAVREKWYENFLAIVKRKHYGLGTDSTVVEFQNHTNYDVDSVAIDFSNTGLFVNSHDILTATHVKANSHKQLLVPVHILGITKRAKILYLKSKQLEFCFVYDTIPPKVMEDPFYCK